MLKQGKLYTEWVQQYHNSELSTKSFIKYNIFQKPELYLYEQLKKCII